MGQTVRVHLTDHIGLPPDEAETLIVEGLRAGDARATFTDDDTWALVVEPSAARVILLRYAARSLDGAGFTIATGHDYDGPDRLLVLSMLYELDRFARGIPPHPRPATYRRFLDG